MCTKVGAVLGGIYLVALPLTKFYSSVWKFKRKWGKGSPFFNEEATHLSIYRSGQPSINTVKIVSSFLLWIPFWLSCKNAGRLTSMGWMKLLPLQEWGQPAPRGQSEKTLGKKPFLTYVRAILLMHMFRLGCLKALQSILTTVTGYFQLFPDAWLRSDHWTLSKSPGPAATDQRAAHEAEPLAPGSQYCKGAGDGRRKPWTGLPPVQVGKPCRELLSREQNSHVWPPCEDGFSSWHF